MGILDNITKEQISQERRLNSLSSREGLIRQLDTLGKQLNVRDANIFIRLLSSNHLSDFNQNLSETSVHRRAFQRAKSEVNIPEGQLFLVTEEHYDAALKFVRDSFMNDEPVIRSVGLQWDAEMVEFWIETFKVNLTLGVLNYDTGEIIALRGTRTVDRKAAFDHSVLEDGPSKTITGMYEFANEKAKFFDKYNVEEAFHLFGFGVDREFRKRGLGGRLFRASMIMLKNLGLDNFCVKGEASSMFSGRVYEKNGFELLYDLPYAEYLVDGKQVICNTGEHTNYRFYGIKIQTSE